MLTSLYGLRAKVCGWGGGSGLTGAGRLVGRRVMHECSGEGKDWSHDG